ncbi:MAG: site-specific integrase [Bacteroidales bacterium]|nr:site-specific integrase [Bacteroidales bacterium]MCM1415444.1 site-specific integrase [bacterium]MCM1423516.1 site-specific integrase [bacterium]
MSTTEPIKNKEALSRFKNYYKDVRPNPRNYTLIVMGLNTAFRISDLLSLRWQDVCTEDGDLRTHIRMTEQKTGKSHIVPINASLRQALFDYYSQCKTAQPHSWLFPSTRYKTQPLSRYQTYRLIRNAAEQCGLSEHISCHSLRKTFGYHAWKQGTPPAMLMDLYNHSSYQITKRYLGITQDERDQVYLQIDL